MIEFCSCGKRCYTERAAGVAINKCKKHRRSKTRAREREFSSNGVPKRKYFCDICGFWHLTSMPAYSEKGSRIKNKIKKGRFK